MHIVLLTGRSAPKVGGLEVVIDALAREFTEVGHRVTVVAPRPGWFRFEKDAHPYEVLRHCPFISKHFGYYSCLSALFGLHKKHPIDIIHAHEVYPQAVIANMFFKKTKVPFVVTSHGVDSTENYKYFRNKSALIRARDALQSARQLVAVSPSIASNYKTLLSSVRTRISDIPNGVHVSSFDNLSDKQITLPKHIPPGEYLLFVGRLSKRKGLEVLLRAYAGLSNPRPLLIIGDGPERVSMEKLSKVLQIEKKVFFLGSREGSEKNLLLKNAWAVVVPTLTWEACSLVVLESFASGKAVIASRVPGVIDLIEHERDGILIEPGNVQELRQAIARFENEEGLRERIAKKGKERADRYDWHAVAQEHLEVYENAISQQE